MPAPLSPDLRRRIYEFRASTQATPEETAARFDVGAATVKRLFATIRKTGSLDPKPARGGKPPAIPPEKFDVLRAIVEAVNDATLQDICDRWFDRTGVRRSTQTMSRVLQDADLPLKKRR
jgi:putative transposase